MRTVIRSAISMPAKINLYMEVGQLRDDGYHEVKTLLHSIGVYDTVHITSELDAANRDHPAFARRTRVSLSHNAGPTVPSGPDNLAIQAAFALAEASEFTAFWDPKPNPTNKVPHTEICIDKQIPIAGGMAGGSADAAGVLMLLNHMWGLDYSTKDLERIGANLGADIPFCLSGQTAVGTGSGTHLTPLLNASEFAWVVGIMPYELSTPLVFKTLDTLRATNHPALTPTPPIAQSMQAVMRGDVHELARALHNDLQPAAMQLLPELAPAMAAMEAAGALRAIVSGSGPTIIGLAEDMAHAQAIQSRLTSSFEQVLVTLSTSSGPAWL